MDQKREEEKQKFFKKEGTLGQRVGALKKGGLGPPNELYNIWAEFVSCTCFYTLFLLHTSAAFKRDIFKIFGKGEELYMRRFDKPLETMGIMWWLNQRLLTVEGISQSQTKKKNTLMYNTHTHTHTHTHIYIYIYICVYIYVYIYIYIYMNLAAYETLCLSLYLSVSLLCVFLNICLSFLVAWCCFINSYPQSNFSFAYDYQMICRAI